MVGDRSARRERGILFSGAMVSAILAGRKTQTRRTIKLQPSATDGMYADRYKKSERWAWWLPDGRMLKPETFACPYGEVGDRPWVRETWRTEERESDCVDGVRFAADDSFREIENTRSAADAWVEANDNGRHGTKWRPSIFMPRWASRLTLEVTDVRIQRLQDITEEDAKAEGVEPSFCQESWLVVREDGSTGNVFVEPDEEWRASAKFVFVKHVPSVQMSTATEVFQRLWDSINGKRAPWTSNPWVWCVSFKRIQP
jgi:hypothetical protein